MDGRRVTCLPLDSEGMRRDLQWFREILQDSYGPQGKAMVFQPSCGGHVTVTSRSEKIFQMLKTDNPVLKVLLQPLQMHTQQYSDAGLFAALLSVNLILSGMDLGLPRHKVAMVTGHTLSQVVEYLRSESCLCRSDLQLSSAGHMISLLRTLLASKDAVCHLSNAELDHVTSLILQGFLKVIPSSSPSSQTFSVRERLHIRSVLGKTATHSKLFDGLLIEGSGDSLRGELEGKHVRPGEEEEGEGEGGRMGRKVELKRDGDGLVVSAVFDISLAGDIEDLPRELTLVTTSDLSKSSSSRGMQGVVVVGLILELMGRLVEEEGVGFVGCQKCIHPLVKEYLLERGVIVSERLSAFHIGSVRDITGAQSISSLSPHGQLGDYLGRLRDIRTVRAEGKSYLLLVSDTAHSSLVLCCKTEAVGDELKPLCSSAVTVLEHSLYSPYVLYGGGCSETILCHYLLQKAEEVTEDVLSELQCDKSELQFLPSVSLCDSDLPLTGTYICVVRNVARAFASVASSHKHCTWNSGVITLTDGALHHKWVFPPYEYCQGHADSSTGVATPDYALKFARLSKTCCCGSVKLSDVSATGCEWTDLYSVLGGFSVIPDALFACLSSPRACTAVANDSSEERRKDGGLPRRVSACVCDGFLPRVKAVELANDLSCAILGIAYAVH